MSVTQKVRTYIAERPFLQEALRDGIINYAALGQRIKQHIDAAYQAEHKLSSVIMAARRCREQLQAPQLPKTHYGAGAEATLKTNLSMLTYRASLKILEKLPALLDAVDFRSGGVLHFVQGSYQFALITNLSHIKAMKKILKKQELIREDSRLVSIALKYSDELIDIPGNLFLLTRALAWENITIIDLVETMSETIFVVNENDGARALRTLSEVMKVNV